MNVRPKPGDKFRCLSNAPFGNTSNDGLTPGRIYTIVEFDQVDFRYSWEHPDGALHYFSCFSSTTEDIVVQLFEEYACFELLASAPPPAAWPRWSCHHRRLDTDVECPVCRAFPGRPRVTD